MLKYGGRQRSSSAFLRVWLLLSCLSAAISMSFAQGQNDFTVTADDIDIQGPSDKVINIIAGVICLIFGLLFTFLGNRLIRFIMFLASFCLLSFAILSICMTVKRPEATDRQKYVVYFAVSLSLGFVLGILFACVWFLGLAAIGALGGLTFGMFLIGLKDGFLIPSKGGRIALLIAMVVVDIVLIFILEKHIVILSTAGSGSWILFNGIDLFAQTGFKNIVSSLTNAAQTGTPYKPNAKVYGMIAGCVLLFILGSVIQYLTYSGPVGVGKIRERRRQQAIEAEVKMAGLPAAEMGERNV